MSIKSLRFITDDPEIRSSLMSMDIRQFNSEHSGFPNSRLEIESHIKRRQTDFCREYKSDFLLDQLKDKKTTSIFFHNGFEIAGLLNFTIKEDINHERYLYIEGMCVPTDHKGNGTKLLNFTKMIANNLDINKISLSYLKDSAGFYKKNNFRLYNDGRAVFNMRGGSGVKTLKNKNKNKKCKKYTKTRKFRE